MKELAFMIVGGVFTVLMLLYTHTIEYDKEVLYLSVIALLISVILTLASGYIRNDVE